jgi:hypothetical protein
MSHKRLSELYGSPSYWFARLHAARLVDNYTEAAIAEQRLERLGVRVTFTAK